MATPPLLIARRGLAYPGARFRPGVDPSHPCNGIAVVSAIAAPGGQFINLLTGQKANISVIPGAVVAAGGTGVYPHIGWAANFTNANANQILPFFTKDPQVSPYPLTFGCIVVINALHNNNQILVSNGDGVFAQFGIFGNTITLNRWNASNDVVSGFTPVANVPYFLAVSTNNTTITNFVWTRLDTGKIQKFTMTPASAVIAGAAQPIFIGNIPSNGTATDCKIAAAMGTQQFRSMPDMLAWAADPWSFWYPNRNFPVDVSGPTGPPPAGPGLIAPSIFRPGQGPTRGLWTARSTFVPSGTVIAGQGASAGVGTATGVGVALFLGVGASSGVGTVVAVGASLATGVGLSAGVGTVTGVGQDIANSTGASSGIGTALGATQSLATSVATASGAGTAAAAGSGVAPLVGASSGAGSAAAIGQSASSGVAASSGAGTAQAFTGIIAVASGISAVAGVGRSSANAVAAASGIGAAAGVGRALRDIVGASSGIGVATGVSAGLIGSVATASGTSAVAGIAVTASYVASTGMFILTGMNAPVIAGGAVTLATGFFKLTGEDANFTGLPVSWVPQPIPFPGWITETVSYILLTQDDLPIILKQNDTVLTVNQPISWVPTAKPTTAWTIVG